MITYLPVQRECRPYIATVHFGAMPAGISRGPIVAPQIWVCTSPVWWLGTGKSEPVRLPAVALIGPTSEAVGVLMDRNLRFPGCGLTTLGWAELVGVPASELVDQAIDCTVLWREPCDRLLQELAHASTEAAQNAATTAFASRIARLARHTADLARIREIDRWLTAPGTVDGLVNRLGLSCRQAGRVVQQTHGLSPKLLSAKHRAMRAANRSMAEPAGSTEVWREYADQSHCIREFRRFLATTPRGYLQDDTAELARSTVSGAT